MTNILRFSLLALLCGSTGCNLVVGLDDIQANPGQSNTATSRHVWSQVIGGDGDDRATAVAVDPANGNIFWGGHSNGEVAFGDGIPPVGGGDDALAAICDPSGNPTWGGRFGDGNAQMVEAVAVHDGKLVIVGTFKGEIDFGEGARTSVKSDIFVAAFDAGNHAPLWTQTFGGGGDDVATGVAIDAAGVVTVVGSYWQEVTFGQTTVSASADAARAFIVRLRGEDGEPLNARDFPMSQPGDESHALGVAIDGNNDITVVGDFSGAMTLEAPCTAAPLQSNSLDGFVVKVSSDLACLFASAVSSDANDGLYAVATLDSPSRVLVAGYGGNVAAMQCSAAVGDDTGSDNILLASFADGGQCDWIGQFAAGQYSEALALAASPDGDVLVGGTFTETVDFGGGALSANGGFAAFLAKMSAGGTHQWSMAFGNTKTRLTGIALDGAEHVVITADANSPTSWGGDPLGQTGNYDAVIAKYDL